MLILSQVQYEWRQLSNLRIINLSIEFNLDPVKFSACRTNSSIEFDPEEASHRKYLNIIK